MVGRLFVLSRRFFVMLVLYFLVIGSQPPENGE
jgi:hypothetical protein